MQDVFDAYQGVDIFYYFCVIIVETEQEGCLPAEIIPYELEAHNNAVRNCWHNGSVESAISKLSCRINVVAMKISINHHEIEVETGANLADVLAANGYDGPGTAVAIGSKVIRKPERATTILSEGTEITVIKAVCGG